MDGVSNNNQATPDGSIPKRRGRKSRRSGSTPIGQAPWQQDAQTTGPEASAILTGFAPAAHALNQFVTDLTTAIISGLADAEKSVNQVTEEAGLAISAGLGPAAGAITRARTDLANSIRSGLASAAEQVTAGTGNPALLTDAAGYPTHPILPIPSHPDMPTPYTTPSAPTPTTPTPTPARSAPLPGSAPPSPGANPIGPKPWGQASTAGPVASSATLSPSAFAAQANARAAKEGLPSLASLCPLPPVPGNTPGGIGSWCYVTPSQLGSNPVPTDIGAIAVSEGGFIYPNPSGDCQFNGTATYACNPITGEPSLPNPLPTTPATPTPTTTTPTPTTTTPSPTTTTPSPTTPTPTTIPQPPPTPPQPPTPPPQPPPPICPPGFRATWVEVVGSASGGYWSCTQIYPTPTPLPPSPTAPTPTPTEPPPTEPPPTEPPPIITVKTSQCGATRDAPCFVAASSIDAAFPHFMHSFGHLDDIVKKKNVAPVIDPKQFLVPEAATAIVDAADQIDNCTRPYQVELTTGGAGLDDFISGKLDVYKVVNEGLKGQDRANGYFAMTIIGPTVLLIDFFTRFFGIMTEGIVKLVTGAGLKLAQASRAMFIFNILNMLTLGSLGKLGRLLKYSIDYDSPTGIPSPSEAASAWLGNQIDECTFQAYVQAGDVRYKPYKQVVMASKFKLTPDQLTILSMRGQIARSDYATRLREDGSLHPEDQTELLALAKQIPGASDLIRYMQRDVDNQDVVNTFQLDSGFTDNYSGKTKEWAAWQGVDEDVMKREWRAHWSIPSPTQLYEMLHRLRHNPKFGGVEKVTADVTKALKQQDILPYWIDKLMAVSYHSLTRTDLARAYDRGWINDETYLNGCYQNGYNDEDAKTLLKFQKSERYLAIKSSDFVYMFVNGEINESQLRTEAANQGYTDEVMDQVVEIAYNFRDYKLQGKIIHQLISAYKSCRINEEQLNQAAADQSIPPDLVRWHMEYAEDNSTCATRVEMAGHLCSMLDADLITSDEYISRMKRAKYDDIAIQHYLALCQNKKKASEAKKKAAEKATAEKEAKAQQSAELRAEQQAARNARRLGMMAMQLERRRQTRNEQLMTATNKLGHYLSDVKAPPAEFVQGLFVMLQQMHGLSQDEAARVLATAATSAKGMTSPEFSAWVQADAMTALNTPWDLYPPGANGTTI